MPSPSYEISEDLSSYTIPLSALSHSYPDHTHLVVGVAITNPQTHKLLIVQRSAREDTFPLLYEIPGGHAEPDVDNTILDTVVRETREETGLVVKKVSKQFEGFEYTNSKGQNTLQLNFLVEVEETGAEKVTLNPEEHQAFAWIDAKDDLDSFQLSGAMVKVVKDALSLLH